MDIYTWERSRWGLGFLCLRSNRAALYVQIYVQEKEVTENKAVIMEICSQPRQARVLGREK